MGRKPKLWCEPGKDGCSVCGAKNKGALASPGFPSFGMLCCGPCLVVGGRYDPPPLLLRRYERMGWLEHSRKAFKREGLKIIY